MTESPFEKLLPPPTKDQLAELDRSTTHWLEAAWNNPDQLGENSAIAEQAALNLKACKLFATPHYSDDAQKFRRILRRAWWACWRARDYTVAGWERRSDESAGKRIANAVLAYIGQTAVKLYGQEWPIYHAPLLNPDGELSVVGHEEATASTLGKLHSDHDRVLNGKNISGLMITKDVLKNKNYIISDAEWSIFLNETRNLSSAHNSYFISDNDISIQYTDNFSYQEVIFECPVRLSNFKLYKGFKEAALCRFEGGLTLGSAHFPPNFDWPDTMETGPYLTLKNCKSDSEITFRECHGVKNFRAIYSALPMRFVDQNMSLIFILGHGAKAQSPSRCSSISISDSLVRNIIIKGILSGGMQITHLEGLRSFVLEHCVIEEEIVLSHLSHHPELTSYLESFGTSPNGFREQDRAVLPEELTQDLYHNSPSFRFADIEFHDLILSGLAIRTNADFSELTCGGGCLIRESHFHKSVDMTNLKTPILEIGNEDDRQEVTVGGDFKVDWMKDDRTSTNLGKALIYDLSVNGCASFENRVFGGETAFERCEFGEAPRFHSAIMNQDTSFRASKFLWRGKFNENTGLQRNSWLGRTERAFRTLAQHMEKIQASDQMSFFHSEQMRARHRRKGDPDVRTIERWLGHLYDGVSDYGGSILKPAILLLILWLFMGLNYYIMGIGWPLNLVHDEPQSATVLTALLLSVTIMLRPFYHFSPTFGRGNKSPECAELKPCETSVDLPVFKPCDTSVDLAAVFVDRSEGWFKFLATFQSLAAVVLIFLMLLAIRRKFQLN